MQNLANIFAMAIVKQTSHVLQNRDTRLVCSHVIHDAVKRLATWVLEASLLALRAVRLARKPCHVQVTAWRLRVVALGDVPIDFAPLKFDRVEIGFDGLAGELVKVAREGLCEVHAQAPQRLARRIRACAIMSHAERTPGRLGRHSIRMVEELCGATYIAKEHDGVPDGTLRLMRLHPVHVPAVNFLPLILCDHTETLVSLLPT